MELLRFATAGSVDDGKSTLIGRLLFDSKGIFEDQLQAVERTSRGRGDEYVNLALLTDGLRAEREQGITIDVAYRYFATPVRKFIIADTPGHVQYTRNMVTGASTADVALVLVDARKGVLEQSRRHAFIAALLRVPRIVVCVNKMDLVDWSQAAFESVRAQFADLASRFELPPLDFIPISALTGDNVVTRSQKMGWYPGIPLLAYLEAAPVAQLGELPGRMAVQYVIRPQSLGHADYRGYAGQITSGRFRVGDEVVVLPAGLRTRLTGIDLHDEQLDAAEAPRSVTLRLADELDVGRGDLICEAARPAQVAQTHRALVCWLSEHPLRPGAKLGLKHLTRSARAQILGLEDRIDVKSLQRERSPGQLDVNDLATLTFRTSAPLAFDPYRQDRTTGSFILIDEASHATVAAGMLLPGDAPLG
jgi:bifunctional enzyme CysN/CysC